MENTKYTNMFHWICQILKSYFLSTDIKLKNNISEILEIIIKIYFLHYDSKPLSILTNKFLMTLKLSSVYFLKQQGNAHPYPQILDLIYAKIKNST